MSPQLRALLNRRLRRRDLAMPETDDWLRLVIDCSADRRHADDSRGITCQCGARRVPAARFVFQHERHLRGQPRGQRRRQPDGRALRGRRRGSRHPGRLGQARRLRQLRHRRRRRRPVPCRQRLLTALPDEQDRRHSSVVGSYPARLEDLERDDITFPGTSVIWSKDAHARTLNAFDDGTIDLDLPAMARTRSTRTCSPGSTG